MMFIIWSFTSSAAQLLCVHKTMYQSCSQRLTTAPCPIGSYLLVKHRTSSSARSRTSSPHGLNFPKVSPLMLSLSSLGPSYPTGEKVLFFWKRYGLHIIKSTNMSLLVAITEPSGMLMCSCCMHTYETMNWQTQIADVSKSSRKL